MFKATWLALSGRDLHKFLLRFDRNMPGHRLCPHHNKYHLRKRTCNPFDIDTCDPELYHPQGCVPILPYHRCPDLSRETGQSKWQESPKELLDPVPW